MKRLCMLLCVLSACLATQALGAPKIFWVSECGTEAAPHDQGFVDVLVAEGYTVDRMLEPRVMDEAKRNLANTYDLVIINRHGDSAQFATNAAEILLWNSISAPMINMNGYLWRNNRWRWLNNGATTDSTSIVTITDPADPILAGVTLNENSQVTIVQTSQSSLCNATSAGNGKLIGYRAIVGGEYAWLARWDTGVEFYVGAAQTAGGPRLAFGGGSTVGVYNLTEAGKMIFLNAVYQMSGATFNRKPVIDAGNNAIAYQGIETALTGSAYDPEGAITVAWTKVSGPGTVSFTNGNTATPTVTFSAKGTYVLQMTVTDAVNTVIDTLTAYVRDAADDTLVARWDFESLPDPNTLIDVTGHGYNGVYNGSGIVTEPNMIAGHIAGSLKAVSCDGASYWEITKSYTIAEPNMNTVATGISIATWVKISRLIPDTIATPMIVGNGLDGWRLQVNANRWNFAFQPGGIDLFGTYPPIDGYWHHVVAVYDGVAAKARIYVDGALNVEANVVPGTLLGKGAAYPLIQIGKRGDAARQWPGQIDDIAIYNYALTGDAIAALATAGDRQLWITAGPDQAVTYKGEPVPMDATLRVNDGIPNPATLEWSVVSVPLGADPAKVIFSDATVEDPMVHFPTVSGTYVLQFKAGDTTRLVADEVSVVITVPTCANILDEGYGFVTDLSGPAGVPDCYVDIYDFMVMANDWLRCNDPINPACEWPYAN